MDVSHLLKETGYNQWLVTHTLNLRKQLQPSIEDLNEDHIWREERAKRGADGRKERERGWSGRSWVPGCSCTSAQLLQHGQWMP